MKIAIISKSDRFSGGASRVAEDLAIWLNDAGHATDHFIAFSQQDLLPFQQSLYTSGFNFELCRKIHGITNKYGFREIFPIEYWINLRKVLDHYDVVHFHDLYSTISPFTLALVARRKPTFFTVHDCSGFTGGCLYPVECDKFISHCDNCPQLPQWSWKDRLCDRTREVQAIKRWLAKYSRVRYIFPSNWVANQARLALSFKFPPEVISNALDLQLFPPITKKEAKVSLGIPENQKVIAISANYLAASHKGVKYAISALQSVQDCSPLVVAVGHCNDDLRRALKGLEVKEMGFISEPLIMAQAYSASDVMLFCSLAEVFGLTVLEAMAASTVVVGFATGGVPEIIQTGRNGVLVECANQEALNVALRETLLSTNLQKMGQQARKDVEANFSKKKFLERHLQLYQESKPFSSEPSQFPILTHSDA
jgi:glycosyltransferase involved in cell wall biosynthesis